MPHFNNPSPMLSLQYRLGMTFGDAKQSVFGGNSPEIQAIEKESAGYNPRKSCPSRLIFNC